MLQADTQIAGFLRHRWHQHALFSCVGMSVGYLVLGGCLVAVEIFLARLPLLELAVAHLAGLSVAGTLALLLLRPGAARRTPALLTGAFLIQAALVGGICAVGDRAIGDWVFVACCFPILTAWGAFPGTGPGVALRPLATGLAFSAGYLPSLGGTVEADAIFHCALGLFGGTVAATLISHSYWTAIRAVQRHNWQLAGMINEANADTRAKSAFLANMSHELRTPMNGVLGMVNILEKSELDEEQRFCVGLIRESSSSLLGLLDDILDLSKANSGHMSLESIRFDLRKLTHGVVNLVRGTKPGSGVEFGADVDPEVPQVLVGDPTRLRQVLLNLVGNAAKFTQAGSVSVKVELAGAGDTAADVRIRVRDTGIGIPPDKLEKIFQPFSQADDTTTRLFGGTGLGLAISQEIVQLMGGHIEVRSQPAVGSEFSFTVSLGLAPLGAADEQEGAGPAERTRVPTRGLLGADFRSAETDGGGLPDRPRLLLAEDNPVNQLVTTKALTRLGMSFELARDGQEAVEAFSRGGFDLVLMDCQMPRLDGREATRAIRDLEAEGTRTPIIALTANALAGDHEAMLAAGMDDYLAKPFTVDALEKVIHRWLPAAQGATDGNA